MIDYKLLAGQQRGKSETGKAALGFGRARATVACGPGGITHNGRESAHARIYIS